MNKQILVVIGVIALGIIVAWVSGMSPQSARAEEEPQEIYQQTQQGNAVVLDVRSQIEYDLGHVKGAELFNVERMKAGNYPEIAKEELIYVYCRSGNRSAQAKSLMESAGFSNIVDIGAYADWERSGGPVAVTKYADYKELLADIAATPIEPLGNEDAPVTMIKYSDFKCPFCLRFAQETEPQIIDEYVESGMVKLEYRNAAFQGEESGRAAEAGYCANEQNAFWDYHDALNESYALIESEETFTSSNLTNIADTINLDVNSFDSCLESGKYAKVVSSETMHAQEQGVNSTPSFIVEGQAVKGALPFNVFETLIESHL